MMHAKKHIKELDSLRGLAALIVVADHYKVLYSNFIENIKHTIFALFIDGSAAVSIFFVLSGFVLSIGFFKGQKINFKIFIIKRFFRLYIPYIFSFFFAVILYLLLSKNGIPELGKWFNGAWTTPLSYSNVMDHIIFIKSFNNGIYNPVYWSLVMEMRISIIFLILIYTFQKFSSFFNLVLWGGIIAIMLIINKKLNLSEDYLVTFAFLPNFILGILLVKHHRAINNIYLKQNLFIKFVLILISLILLRYSGGILKLFSIYSTVTYYTLTGIGASILIILAMNNKIIKSFLLLKPIYFIGKISYSIYLVHAIVLYSFIYVYYGHINNYLIALLSFIFTIFISYIFYVYIEVKSIELGRKVVNYVNK